MKIAFIHGACVRDGSWWWHPTAAVLERRGIETLAPLMPSCGETGVAVTAQAPTLRDDAAAVRRALQHLDEPVVLVGHSYGGIVATEAAADLPHVARMVFVSSYLPEAGESLSSFGGAEPAPFLDIDHAAGTFSVSVDALSDTFLQDCSPEIQQAAQSRTARQSLSVLTDPVQTASWRRMPTTYVVCTNDRGTPVDVQRKFAERANAVVELEAGHHPFMSQPDAMAALLTDLG
jgi:pimeloyl-ACP methyl ester carboxylesterase